MRQWETLRFEPSLKHHIDGKPGLVRAVMNEDVVDSPLKTFLKTFRERSLQRPPPGVGSPQVQSDRGELVLESKFLRTDGKSLGGGAQDPLFPLDRLEMNPKFPMKCRSIDRGWVREIAVDPVDAPIRFDADCGGTIPGRYVSDLPF